MSMLEYGSGQMPEHPRQVFGPGKGGAPKLSNADETVSGIARFDRLNDEKNELLCTPLNSWVKRLGMFADSKKIQIGKLSEASPAQLLGLLNEIDEEIDRAQKVDAERAQ